MTEKMVKGAVVKSYLKFVKKKWGIGAHTEAMNVGNLDGIPKDSAWVPVESLINILQWIKDKYGDEYVVAAGKYSMTDLGPFTYLFTSFISIETFLKRARDKYNDYKALFNYGEFIIDNNDKGAVVTIKDARDSEVACMAWEGGMGRSTSGNFSAY